MVGINQIVFIRFNAIVLFGLINLVGRNIKFANVQRLQITQHSFKCSVLHQRGGTVHIGVVSGQIVKHTALNFLGWRSNRLFTYWNMVRSSNRSLSNFLYLSGRDVYWQWCVIRSRLRRNEIRVNHFVRRNVRGQVSWCSVRGGCHRRFWICRSDLINPCSRDFRWRGLSDGNGRFLFCRNVINRCVWRFLSRCKLGRQMHRWRRYVSHQGRGGNHVLRVNDRIITIVTARCRNRAHHFNVRHRNGRDSGCCGVTLQQGRRRVSSHVRHVDLFLSNRSCWRSGNNRRNSGRCSLRRRLRHVRSSRSDRYRMRYWRCLWYERRSSSRGGSNLSGCNVQVRGQPLLNGNFLSQHSGGVFVVRGIQFNRSISTFGRRCSVEGGECRVIVLSGDSGVVLRFGNGSRSGFNCACHSIGSSNGQQRRDYGG